MIVDLRLLEKKSIVKINNIEKRRIESGHRSKRPKHYKFDLAFPYLPLTCNLIIFSLLIILIRLFKILKYNDLLIKF